MTSRTLPATHGQTPEGGREEPLLSVRNLTTRFRGERGTVTAVDDVSFDVSVGETLAIVGESGSGKSVTALSILRLIPDPPGSIEGGQIMFDGRDLLTLSPAQIRSLRGDRIAMIFQEPMSSLNPALTVGLQVAEPLNVHQRTPWGAALDKAVELIARVRIPDARSRLKAYPHQFSGGMRQRVMIAMALACEPQLIIADEPTTALDVTVQAQILDLLADQQRERYMGVILVTHDLGVVAGRADHIAVMYAGRIVETADTRTLFYAPKHPYTRALQRSIPSLQPKGTELYTIAGMPPDLSKPLPGCSFTPRCEFATERCHASRPALVEVSPTQAQSCLRVQAGEL